MTPGPIDELIEKLTERHREHARVFGVSTSLYGEAASALTSLQERNRKLEEGLTKAAKQFREYEAHHRAKARSRQPAPACYSGEVQSAVNSRNAEVEEKAERNRLMAEMCEALSGAGE